MDEQRQLIEHELAVTRKQREDYANACAQLNAHLAIAQARIATLEAGVQKPEPVAQDKRRSRTISPIG